MPVPACLRGKRPHRRNERLNAMAGHEVRIGSKVHTNDNKTIGEVHRLVIDPNTRLISTLVVGGHLGPERLVDVELIEKSDKDGVWLSIPEYRAETLPPFVHE